MEVKGRRRKRRKQLPDDVTEKREYCKLRKGSTRSHSVENWLWQRLWTCRNTDYGMYEREILAWVM